MESSKMDNFRKQMKLLNSFQSTAAFEEAQELVDQAWQTGKKSDRIALAKKALSLFPDCAEAYLVMAVSTQSVKKQYELFNQALESAKRTLPQDALSREDYPF